MEREEATKKFESAKAFYAAKHFEEALRLLDELNRAFPLNRRIILARARVMASLGDTEAALFLCDKLIEMFSDQRAEQMNERVMVFQSLPD